MKSWTNYTYIWITVLTRTNLWRGKIEIEIEIDRWIGIHIYFNNDVNVPSWMCTRFSILSWIKKKLYINYTRSLSLSRYLSLCICLQDEKFAYLHKRKAHIHAKNIKWRFSILFIFQNVIRTIYIFFCFGCFSF